MVLLHDIQRALGRPLRPVARPQPAQERPKRGPTRSLTAADLKDLTDLVRINCSKFRERADEEDIYQQLVVQLLESDYMARYDSTRNSVRGYLSSVVYNHFCRRYKVAGYAVNRADEFDTVRGTVRYGFEEYVPDQPEPAAADLDERSMADLEVVARQLDEFFPYTSGAWYRDGKYVGACYLGEEPGPADFFLWRSSSVIWRALALGFQQRELAKALWVSKGYICKTIKRIRGSAVVQSWSVVHGRAPTDADDGQDTESET